MLTLEELVGPVTFHLIVRVSLVAVFMGALLSSITYTTRYFMGVARRNPERIEYISLTIWNYLLTLLFDYSYQHVIQHEDVYRMSSPVIIMQALLQFTMAWACIDAIATFIMNRVNQQRYPNLPENIVLFCSGITIGFVVMVFATAS